MASTNIQRAPVVKLAVLGDESDNGSYKDLARYLSDFKYTLISDSGSNSYKFEIELINMDESFAQSLLSGFTMALGGQDPTDVKAVATASPVLAIQWGYKDSLSNVHLARISDISYKFSQSKEKILKVTCVDNGDLVRLYSELSAETKPVPFSINMHTPGGDVPLSEGDIRRDSEGRSFAGYENNTFLSNIPLHSSLIKGTKPLRFFTILKDVIGQLIYALPGYAVTFDNVPQDSINKTYSEIILHFTKVSMIEWFAAQTTLDATAERRIIYRKENNLDESLRIYHGSHNVVHSDITIAEVNAVKFEAWKKLFNVFDMELENFTDFGKVQGSSYLPLKRSVTADAGKDGNITSFVPLSQLKDSSKLKDITPVVKDKAAQNLIYVIPHADNSELQGYFEDAINLHNSDPDNRYVSFEDASLKVLISETMSNSIAAGAEMQIVPRTISLKTDDGLTVLINGTKPFTIHGNIWARTSTMETTEPLAEVRNKVNAAIHAKEQESVVSEVFTKEQQEQGGSTYDPETGSGDILTFSQLPPETQQDLLYSDLRVSVVSEKGQTLETTVRGILDTHNTLMLDNGDDLKSEIWPITPRGSFAEVLDGFKSEAELKRLPVSAFVILPKGNKNLKRHLKPIGSYSHIQTDAPNVIKLGYGTADSIVKHFDFDGDMRYLINLLAQVTMEKTFETYAEHLTTTSIKTVVFPMLSLIIQDTDFILAMTQQGEKGMAVLELLKALASRTSFISSVDNSYPPIDVESIEDLGIAIDYLENDGQSRSIHGNFDEKRLSTTVKFLKAITNSIIAAALFNDFEPEASTKGLAGAKAYLEYISPLDEEWKTLESKASKSHEKYETWAGNGSWYNWLLSKFGSDHSEEENNEGNAGLASLSKLEHAEAMSEKYAQSLKLAESQQKFILDGVVERTNPYILKGSNIFDTYNTMAAAFTKDTRMAMGWYRDNVEQVWELKVKTLGIPEIDTMIEISTPRKFWFEVHDLSKEKDKAQTNIHWLTGAYRPIAVSHHISPSIGYITDFKLLKEVSQKEPGRSA